MFGFFFVFQPFHRLLAFVFSLQPLTLNASHLTLILDLTLRHYYPARRFLPPPAGGPALASIGSQAEEEADAL